MSVRFAGGVAGTSSFTTANSAKDVEVADPPSDSISSLAFSSAGDYLAVGSWNNEVSSMNLLPLSLCASEFDDSLSRIGPDLRG